MTQEEIVDKLENIAGFFHARAGMAIGDGKMLFLSWFNAAEQAIALLKAQEPVEPKWRKGYAYCGQCGYKLHWIVDRNNFCPNCGSAVKWE